MEEQDKIQDVTDSKLLGESSPENETLAQRLTRIANTTERKSMIQNKIELGDRIIHFLLAGTILGFCVYLVILLFP